MTINGSLEADNCWNWFGSATMPCMTKVPVMLCSACDFLLFFSLMFIASWSTVPLQPSHSHSRQEPEETYKEKETFPSASSRLSTSLARTGLCGHSQLPMTPGKQALHCCIYSRKWVSHSMVSAIVALLSLSGLFL